MGALIYLNSRNSDPLGLESLFHLFSGLHHAALICLVSSPTSFSLHGPDSTQAMVAFASLMVVLHRLIVSFFFHFTSGYQFLIRLVPFVSLSLYLWTQVALFIFAIVMVSISSCMGLGTASLIFVHYFGACICVLCCMFTCFRVAHRGGSVSVPGLHEVSFLPSARHSASAAGTSAISALHRLSVLRLRSRILPRKGTRSVPSPREREIISYWLTPALENGAALSALATPCVACPARGPCGLLRLWPPPPPPYGVPHFRWQQ
jgi:hypothetical protein